MAEVCVPTWQVMSEAMLDMAQPCVRMDVKRVEEFRVNVNMKLKNGDGELLNTDWAYSIDKEAQSCYSRKQ